MEISVKNESRTTDLQGWVKLQRDTSTETVIIPTTQPQLDTRLGFKKTRELVNGPSLPSRIMTNLTFLHSETECRHCLWVPKWLLFHIVVLRKE